MPSDPVPSQYRTSPCPGARSHPSHAVLLTASAGQLPVFSKNENPKGGEEAGDGRQNPSRVAGVDPSFYPRQVWMIVDNGNDEAVDKVENTAKSQETKNDLPLRFEWFHDLDIRPALSGPNQLGAFGVRSLWAVS